MGHPGGHDHGQTLLGVFHGLNNDGNRDFHDRTCTGLDRAGIFPSMGMILKGKNAVQDKPGIHGALPLLVQV